MRWQTLMRGTGMLAGVGANRRGVWVRDEQEAVEGMA